MGGALSLGSLACCAATEGAMCACRLCRCCMSSSSSSSKKSGMSNRCANSLYLLVMVFMAGLALALQHWGAPEFHIYSFDVGCKNVPHLDEAACKGDGAVYRISMGLFLWFVFLTLGTLFGSRKFHVGWWGLKTLLFLVLIVGAFFVPNDVFGAGESSDGKQVAGSYGYAQFSRIVSAFFLISQIVAFIDFAYHWNGTWVQNAYGGVDDEDSEVVDRRWLAGILACCAVMALITVIGIGALYVVYGACTLSAMFITLTAVAVIGFTVLQLTAADSDGSLLTSCVVAVYCVYLCWSAVNSNPETCNPGSKASSDPGQIALGMAVAAFSLGWTCYSATASATTVTTGPAAATKEAVAAADADSANSMSQPLNASRPKTNKLRSASKDDDPLLEHKSGSGDLEDPEAAEDDGESADVGPAGGAQPDSRIWFFHVIMGAGALYMAMLLTNWGTGTDPSAGHSPSTGEAQMWVKIVSQWLAIGLYVWTIIAPRCCPDRDFS